MSTSIAETLRSLRTERGLSQEQLAEKLHVDRTTVVRWESGSRTPDATVIFRLSEILGVEPGILLSRAAEPDERPHVILVDDEKIILTGSLPVLKKALPGADVAGFASPSAALEYAQHNQVALAFLDIELGKTSGLDLCSALLKINPRCNVIFLTAYEGYSVNAWNTGASGFALKPLTEELVRRQLTLLRYPVRGLV